MSSTAAVAGPSQALLGEIATGELFSRFRDAFYQTSRLQLRLVPERPMGTDSTGAGVISLYIPVNASGSIFGYLMLDPFTLRPEDNESDPLSRDAMFPEAADTVETAVRPTRPRHTPATLPSLNPRLAGAAETMLRLFALQLGEHAEKRWVHQMAVEPLIVRKAREYIADHLGEPLSLDQAAAFAGASLCNFCKVFKKSTGLTFTAFVNQARVEEAKRLLLLPHRAVTEVAFQSGFQSLSQFNRCFKKLVSVSPRGYREAQGQSMRRHPQDPRSNPDGKMASSGHRRKKP